MSDAAHDHGHDHHGSVAAEPDNVKAGLIFGWGMGMLMAVVASIVLISAYFFQALDAAEAEKVGSRSQIGTDLDDLRAYESDTLNGYKKLEGGKFQIPVDQAMQAVSKEGL